MKFWPRVLSFRHTACWKPIYLCLPLGERRLRTWRKFHLNTTTLVRSSVRHRLPVYHHTGYMTAPSTSSPALRLLGAVYSPPLVRRLRPWRSTSVRPSLRISSDYLHPLLVPGSSSLAKRKGPYAHALTIGHLTSSRSRTDTLYPWCRLPSNSYRGQLWSPSWICATPTTYSTLEKGTNGRSPSTPPQDTGNT